MSNNEPEMHYKWLLYCYLLSSKLLSGPLPQSINLSDAVYWTDAYHVTRLLLIMSTLSVKTCDLHAFADVLS